MTWKRRTINTEAEKEIITGLIVNDQFNKEIQKILEPELFQTPYAKTVSRWCVEYYDKYKKAPGNDIQGIYNSYSKKQNVDESQVELIGKFLEGLSDEHKKQTIFNLEYALDNAELFFRIKKIENHKDNLSALLLKNEVDECEKEIAHFKRVERPSSVGIDILNDNINTFLYQEDDVLFRFPGDLGQMMGNFCRSDFVAIAAPMKRGKTWWLIEFAVRALLAGLKVMYYDLESGNNKMLRRFYQHFSGQSKKPETVTIPFFDNNFIEHKEVRKEGLTGKIIDRKRKHLKTMISDGQLRLVSFPTYSINVDDIKTHLDNLEHYNKFIPDVIIVDYADILAAEKYMAGKEERHKLNATWGGFRGLAQERHCLLVTGSQTLRSTFTRDIDQGDLAEDIRKLAHVTQMFALNQTKEDKKRGVMRVGALALRDDDFHIDNEVIVLQCLSIGKPCLDTRWKHKVKNI